MFVFSRFVYFFEMKAFGANASTFMHADIMST